MNEKILKEIVETPSVSGFEENIRSVLFRELKPVVDEIKIDRIGNLIARKGKGKPVIAIVAHMDQIGLIVKYVDENGFIRFDLVGGWDERVLLGQKVVINTEKRKVAGVIGIRPVHLQEKEEKRKPISINDMFIDVGAKNRKEVEDELHVKIGDFVTLHSEISKLHKRRYTGAGFDNRIGCFEAVEIMRRLKKANCTVFFIGTVKEEIGLVGARSSIFSVNPDFVIGLDVTISGDTPDIKPAEAIPKLGKGAVISIKDAVAVIDPEIRKWVEKIAKSNKIKIQYDIIRHGATDSSISSMVREGIPSITILTPCRYLHTRVEVIDLDDVENVIQLVLSILKNSHELN